MEGRKFWGYCTDPQKSFFQTDFYLQSPQITSNRWPSPTQHILYFLHKYSSFFWAPGNWNGDNESLPPCFSPLLQTPLSRTKRPENQPWAFVIIFWFSSRLPKRAALLGFMHWAPVMYQALHMQHTKTIPKSVPEDCSEVTGEPINQLYHQR